MTLQHAANINRLSLMLCERERERERERRRVASLLWRHVRSKVLQGASPAQLQISVHRLRTLPIILFSPFLVKLKRHNHHGEARRP